MLFVFAYHNFCKEYNNKDSKLYVDVDTFSKQIKFFKKRFNNFVFLKDYIKNYDKLKDDVCVSITVDDGMSNFNLIYNLLEKEGLKIDLFVSSKKIGIHEYSKDLKKNVAYLTEDMLSGFDNNIVNVQSHGASHRDLTKVISHEHSEEFLGSKNKLEHFIDSKINIFCYPYGGYDKMVVDGLKKVGYIGACTTISGINKALKPFEIKRIPVSSYDDAHKLKIKILSYE